MNLVQNDWNAIRALYADCSSMIMSSPRNEWGMAAYTWEDRDHILTMTPIEAWLWHDIRACNAVLYPQYPVLNFFVDFANPVAKVAIECDGKAYHQDKAKDAARDQRLTDAGWTVYRISGSDCRKDSDEETGAPAAPYLFIQQICERHGISRNSIERADPDEDDSGGFTHVGSPSSRVMRMVAAHRGEVLE
jgi:very-short-patch-repair endonuclease